MTIKSDWNIEISIDDILRSQAADPEIIRERSPSLVAVAEEALVEGRSLIEPKVLTKVVEIQEVRHRWVVVEGGRRLSGPLVVETLGRADRVALMVCTVGSRLSETAVEVFQTRPTLGFALDAVASAAVFALSAAACNDVELAAVASASRTSVPISPGLVGWPVDPGQREVLDITDPGEIGVSFTSTLEMIPLKTVTVAIGIGPNVVSGGSVCEFCGLRETCKMREV